jgi:penicillin amidase
VIKPEECLARHDGETRVAGLDGPVSIVRDCWGIPHVRATTTHDAFFAQGFCMGQDRAWQIELQRHMARGTTASLINKGLLNLDRSNRTLGFGRLADKEWTHQTPEARAVLEAYAAGVNAAIATQPVPFEFRVLGHSMRPWTPADSLAIIKMVSAGQIWAAKLKYGQIAAHLGAEAVEAMLPVVPEGSSIIVPSGASWTGEPHPYLRDITVAMGEPDGVVAAGGGSNCWVVAGARSESGAPLVAGDPHLPVTLPGQWYLMHIECPEFTVAGAVNPGYPGPMFYGHNTEVAWTMTHAQGDRFDLYRERIRKGARGPEALFRGEWQPLERIDERFEVRSEDAGKGETWLTRHGPVVFGDPERDDEVVAAAWGLAEPAHDIDAMLAMLRASNTAEAHDALRTYDSLSGNFCFADMAGEIGYQYAGRIPRRKPAIVPVPGWTGEHEWDGDVPKAELPATGNPANGYLLTANNKTTTADYPHYLSYVATTYRADRLRELLQAQDTFDTADMAAMQGDQTSVPARGFAAAFASARPATDGGRQLAAMFAGWDARLNAESPAALALDAVCEALAERTVRAFFAPVKVAPAVTGPEERRILFDQLTSRSGLMLVADSDWEGAFAGALESAANTLRDRFGEDRADWRWDSVHQVRWRHNLGRDGELADVLNAPNVPIGGDGTTPFATAADLDGYVMAGVSYRQIFDMSDLNGAQVCIPPGNSGQPGSPHYLDNLERWRAVEYHPLFIDWGDIEANAEAHQRLVPRPLGPSQLDEAPVALVPQRG